MMYLRVYGDKRYSCSCRCVGCVNKLYDLQINEKWTIRIVHYWGEPHNLILGWNEDTGKQPAAFVTDVGELSMNILRRPTQLQCKQILDALGVNNSLEYEKLQLRYELTRGE